MNTAPECVDMTESLRRGAGRLLYNGDEGSLVLSTDGTFLLSDIPVSYTHLTLPTT